MSSDFQPDPNVLKMNLRPPAKVTEKPVATVYRCNLKVEWFRRFSIKERLQILFGCNLVVMTGIATQHSPGKFQPLVIGRVSYDKDATEHMKRICSNMLEEQSDKDPVQHEDNGK